MLKLMGEKSRERKPETGRRSVVPKKRQQRFNQWISSQKEQFTAWLWKPHPETFWAIIGAVIVAIGTVFSQSHLDDQRSLREIEIARERSQADARQENLRFVRERSGTEYQERPFQGIDLYQQNLNDLNLDGADLRSARLHQATMIGTKLRNSNLVSTDLNEANLGHADLRHADLRKAKLRDANLFKADLEQANLRDANLFGADLGRANLRDADFFGASLGRANLRDADFFGASLGRADLRDADFFGADLGQANLRDADLFGADLRRANLQGADLRPDTALQPLLNGTSMAYVNLNQAILLGADLSRVGQLDTATYEVICYDSNTRWPEGYEPAVEPGRLEAEKTYSSNGKVLLSRGEVCVE